MQLAIFRTFWGVDLPLAQAAAEAAAAGFDGLELPCPRESAGRAALAKVLAQHDMQWIAEICTAGSYVPNRNATLAEHCQDLEAGLRQCAESRPVRVNCLGGLDAWELDDSLRFFEHGMNVAARLGLELCFETHRSRVLFNPWLTPKVLSALPEIRLTADISHWCVVAERLMDSEPEVIARMAPHVRHIHARVGYDQGPQVPHPAAPEYAQCLRSHQHCWERFWSAQQAAGLQECTLTPEFGPDGYLQQAPFTQQPVADLWELNRWMAQTERHHFHLWSARQQATA